MGLYVPAIYTVGGADVCFVDDMIGWVGLHNNRNQSILAPGAQHHDQSEHGPIQAILYRSWMGALPLRDCIRS